MAKRPMDEDEDDEKPVRKRRYKPKKTDDDEDAPSPPGRGGGKQEEDDEDEDGEGSISTGNVYLDIALDFRDDCIEWAQAHVMYAIIIGVVTFLIITALAYFFISSWIHYLKRPSLETVIVSYDFGYFPETKLLADHALLYLSHKHPERRSPFIFFQGAAFCAIADRVVPADRRDYYLIAANYLKEAAIYNFLPSRADEGWFLLGKSLYHCGELEQCRDPLRLALEGGYPHTKELYWYLANSYFWGASPDLSRARQYLHHYQNEPTVLEEEVAESYLLESLIALRIEGIKAAEDVLAKVPRFAQFTIRRHFVEGQIELFKARELTQQAIALETDPNPRSPHTLPVVPVPVMPEPELPTVPATPPEEIPTVPAPVEPMDEALLQEFMLPHPPPAAVLGVFDGTSEIQQRIAEMQARYANDAEEEDEIIVLPREETRPAPVPTVQPQEIEVVFDPLDYNPTLRRAREFREAADEHYQRAIDHFVETIRLVTDPENLWGRSARLLAGICYVEKGQPKEGSVLFRSLIDAFPESSEAIAAGFLLGELERALGNTDAALRAFAQSFNHLRQNPSYTSHWLPHTVIVERSASIVRSDIERQNYADAIKLLTMLNGVMPAAERVRLTGEAYESWASLLQTQAETTFGERGEQLVKEAESAWCEAGSAFATLAQLLSGTQEFSELLWRGAENYRLGKDYRRAILEYLKFRRANWVARRPEVHLRLGEMYLHLDRLTDSANILEEALHDFPSHNLVPQIRLVLSHVYGEWKEWDKARALLQLNLLGEADPTSGPYRDALYELGTICFMQGDLDRAIPYLEDAVRVHPRAIQAANAHYTLARAYLKRVEDLLEELTDNPPAAVRQSLESQVQTNRRRALLYLAQTEQILKDRQQGIGLTESEKLMLRNVMFITCSILLKMEQYEQVILLLNTVATMYQDSEESLDALVKMAYAMRMLGRDAESLTTLRRAEVILNQLEKSGTINEADGAHWRTVLQGAQPIEIGR